MSCCDQPCCLSSQARKRRHSLQSCGDGVVVPMPLFYGARSLVLCAAISSKGFRGEGMPVAVGDGFLQPPTRFRTVFIALTTVSFNHGLPERLRSRKPEPYSDFCSNSKATA